MSDVTVATKRVGRRSAEPRPWRSPRLAHFGRLTDLVLGGGKTGPQADSDPQSTRKQGVG